MDHEKTHISGALMDKDWKPWIPHQPVTNDEAIDAIVRHMKRDALDPRLMNEKHRGCNGPVEPDGTAGGNFFIASAGFAVYNLTTAQRDRLIVAWQEHAKSRQYAIAVELCKLSAQMNAACDALPYEKDMRVRESKRSTARQPYMGNIKRLEAEIEGIYRAGACK